LTWPSKRDMLCFVRGKIGVCEYKGRNSCIILQFRKAFSWASTYTCLPPLPKKTPVEGFIYMLIRLVVLASCSCLASAFGVPALLAGTTHSGSFCKQTRPALPNTPGEPSDVVAALARAKPCLQKYGRNSCVLTLCSCVLTLCWLSLYGCMYADFKIV